MSLLTGACGSEDGGLPFDSGMLPDGYKFVACDTPGSPCNAHDPCAINPICGNDGLCHPTFYQNCNDDLACTQDVCLGAGKCDHIPASGQCALAVKQAGGPSKVQCFNTDDRNPADPCKVCDPERSGKAWSPATGGSCNDGEDCTKDDYCDNGVCKGTYYGDQCQDEYGCTEDVCDGKGGCLGNKLMADSCLINGACYKKGDTDAQKCNVCDPSKSTNAWTPLSLHCLINGRCEAPGAVSPDGCGECDPAKNTSDWTPVAGLCKISGKCYKSGDKNTSAGGCAECDPTANATGWTVKGDNCLIGSKCINPGDKDSLGCGECKPATNKYDYTAIANKCLIENKCFAPGEKDPTNCGECDPTVSGNSWTVKGDNCLVSGKCYNPGDPNDDGCAQCKPTSDKYAFTPLTSKCTIGANCYADTEADSSGCMQCLVATPGKWSVKGTTKITIYNFESGLMGWTATNSDAKVGWIASSRRPATGSQSLYYGDPAVGSFSTGATANKGTVLSPSIALSAGKKAGVRLWLYGDIEKGTFGDLITISVVESGKTTSLWTKPSTFVQKTWFEVSLDLSSYAGKTIQLKIEFDTLDGFVNDGEGLFVDDISVYENC